MFAIWVTIANALCIGALVLFVVVAVWFAVVNYVGDESRHPLDFYSNKMRTRPYLFGLMATYMLSVAITVAATGQVALLNSRLPELSIAVTLQGMIISITAFLCESAGAALAGMMLYTLVAAPTILMVTIPPPYTTRPGIAYGSGYVILNCIWVLWINLAAGRHTGRDKAESPLPPGAERLLKLWSQAVLVGAVPLLMLTNILYLAAEMIEDGKYGWAIAVAYWAFAALLIYGCCRRFHLETEIDV